MFDWFEAAVAAVGSKNVLLNLCPRPSALNFAEIDPYDILLTHIFGGPGVQYVQNLGLIAQDSAKWQPF